MKINGKGITALLFLAVLGMGLGGCGAGEDGGVPGGTNPTQTSNVSVKTGSIATDSWGYSGAAPIQISAPDTAAILLQGHTLLEDASHSVVSGTIPTKISFSSDVTSLGAAARASAPANLLCYLDISLGPAQAALPALSVTVAAGAASGETVTVYNFDASSGKWVSVQTALADASGKVSFPVNQLSLWGVFH